MAIELRWLVSTAASTLHTSAAILRGQRLVDDRTSAALALETRELGADLAAIGLASERFFEHAIPLSARIEPPDHLAEVVVAKALGPDHQRATDRLAKRLIALEAAFQGANPRALDELELRADPLRGQWEARGPGLMATLERLTERELLVAEAEVVLVQPVQGGGGTSHWLYNSVSIEAVLANPLAELPEVARLAWLLAQLNLDLPKFQDQMPRGRMAQIGPLAMIPPVLAAAQEVELVHFDGRTLATALAAWRPNAATAVDPVQLMQWWETYQASTPTWTVALGALERMLSDAATEDATGPADNDVPS